MAASPPSPHLLLDGLPGLHVHLHEGDGLGGQHHGYHTIDITAPMSVLTLTSLLANCCSPLSLPQLQAPDQHYVWHREENVWALDLSTDLDRCTWHV